MKSKLFNLAMSISGIAILVFLLTSPIYISYISYNLVLLDSIFGNSSNIFIIFYRIFIISTYVIIVGVYTLFIKFFIIRYSEMKNSRTVTHNGKNVFDK